MRVICTCNVHVYVCMRAHLCVGVCGFVLPSWQCFSGIKGGRGIAIRTFITNDFMTGIPATPGKEIPENVLNTMNSEILSRVKGISRVCYDLTSKPPATTEWE